MRVLLTGAGGFVGHHTLAHILKHTDWHVVVIDSFRHKGLSARLRAVVDECADFWARVTAITHDLRAPIDTITDHEIGPIDAVIAMAAESHVDRSIAEPRLFVENNVGVALTMLEWARMRELTHFILISTDEVYGPAYGDQRHPEWSTILPSNPYSASKACQEAISIAYWRTYGIPVVITNTMNIIGERQDREKFIPYVTWAVLHDQVVKVHASLNGVPGSRFYLHARNQADALVYLLQHLLPIAYNDGASRPARFNIVGEEELDNLEMAQAIATVVGKPLRYELVGFHASRPGHDLRYGLDGTKMAHYGWKPPVPLRESLRRTVEWTLRNPEWLM